MSLKSEFVFFQSFRIIIPTHFLKILLLLPLNAKLCILTSYMKYSGPKITKKSQKQAVATFGEERMRTVSQLLL